MSGFYSADLLNTESITSTFTVSITLYNGYKGMAIGGTIEMTDQQPANKVMHVATPLWCLNPTTENDYWLHTSVSAQDNNGKVWFEEVEWIRINLATKSSVTP